MLKNKKIAVFLNAWSGEHISRVLEGIKDEAKKDNVDLFVFTSLIYFADHELQNKTQLRLAELPNPSDFDGAIVFTNTFNLPDEETAVRDSFQAAGVPMISLETKVNNMAFAGTENYNGIYELTTHLIKEHGVKDVIYFAGIQYNQEDEIRKQALTDALKDHNMTIRESLRGDYGFHTAWRTMASWLEKNDKLPDAFVCANDYTALGVCNALYEKGYDVPKDVIVTGFDHCSNGVIADPMVATVARDWDNLGHRAYLELINQIEKFDPTVDIVLPSYFVPSESCGCKAPVGDADYKKAKLRKIYEEHVRSDMLEYFFKNLRNNLQRVFDKNDFYELTKTEFENNEYMGPDFMICTIPEYFELTDEVYVNSVKKYGKKMDVLYEKRNGKSVFPYNFDTKDVVPNYEYKENESNLYVIAPLNYMDSLIGYVVAKNNVDMLYTGMLYIWCMNMNSLFTHIRRLIFAERSNNELRKIYMTDFLTGMYNRTGCNKVLYSFVENQKNNNKASILMFADIDCMKSINDKFGHLKGDLAIKATADALKKFLPSEWLFARFGGDEFVMVGDYDRNTNYDDIKDELIEEMDKYFESLELDFPLSVSVGCVYVNPKDDREIEHFVQIADDAMYKKKQDAHMRLKDKFETKEKNVSEK